MEAARECSAEISPELFERYIWLWRQDLRDWQQRVAGVSRMPSLDVALHALDLARSANGRGVNVARLVLGDSGRDRGAADGTVWRTGPYGLFMRS